MRFLGLLAAVAIIYVLISRHASKPASSDIKEEIQMIDQNLPAGAVSAAKGSAGEAATDYKRALDRAHAVVKQVEAQHADDTRF